MAGSQVDLSQLNIKELQGLHQRLSTEVANLTSSAVALQETAARFATAGQSIEYLQEQKQGQSVLLPLTESLYVSGSLESVERVLVEVGTGYYVEREVHDGVDYCRRKVMLVKDKVSQLADIMQARQITSWILQAVLQQVGAVLAEKIAVLQQQQGKQ